MEPPSRWLKCPRKGGLVKDLFLPCKTPLDSKFDSQVPLQYRFDLDMLFSSMSQYQCKIGMLVDLTNTSRFYHKDKVEEDHKCKYVKMHCKGHGQTPSDDQVKLFITCVKNFRQKFPLDKIAIHCTHGFNRTGFMIVSYLVLELDWSCEMAVRAFAEARPPGIYKQDYLEELWNRYEDGNECPAAPELPDWCLEEEEKDDDNAPLSDGAGPMDDEDAVVPAQSRPNRKRPAGGPGGARRGAGRGDGHGKISQFMSGVKGVQQVLDAETVSRVRGAARDGCGFKSGRFPGCQPVSMDIRNLRLLQQKQYRVSWKADGFRYLMIILGRSQVYAIDRDNSVFLVPNLEFPSRKDPTRHLEHTVLDGELVIDTVQGVSTARYLVYDAMVFDSQPVGKCPFDRRLQCVEREIVGPRTAMKQQLAGRPASARPPEEPFSVRLKGFYDIQACRKLLSDEFTKSLGHETDGLVFQPADADDVYIGGSFDKLLKWKPPELNTVDFKLQWYRKRQQGCLEEHWGALYVGGEESPIAQIRINRGQAQRYDAKIVECRYDFQLRTWIILRERVDKSFPNHLDTVKAVVASIKEPVTKDVLLQFVDSVVKAREKARDHQLMPPPPPMTGRVC